MDLKELKRDFEILAKKYSLPYFDTLNETFELEKLDRETMTILRSVRKVMMEKIVNSLGFLEMLLNPMNAPMMYVSYIRSMSDEDRKLINKMYISLAELSLNALDREISYDEKSEAEMIRKIYQTWADIKSDFTTLLKSMKKPSIAQPKKERNYFG